MCDEFQCKNANLAIVKHTTVVQLIGDPFVDQEENGKIVIRVHGAQFTLLDWPLCAGIPIILPFRSLLQLIRQNAD